MKPFNGCLCVTSACHLYIQRISVKMHFTLWMELAFTFIHQSKYLQMVKGCVYVMCVFAKCRILRIKRRGALCVFSIRVQICLNHILRYESLLWLEFASLSSTWSFTSTLLLWVRLFTMSDKFWRILLFPEQRCLEKTRTECCTFDVELVSASDQDCPTVFTKHVFWWCLMTT